MNNFMDAHLEYDDFAWFYNKHWGPYANKAIQILDTLLLAKLPHNSRILDLCCGTGQLAGLLTERKYRVTGIDISREMLAFAMINAPAAQLILADARDFTLAQVFDGVISTYDSLNHILNLDELVAVLNSVYAVLEDGGIFTFDVNTEEGYLNHWQDCTFHIIEDDHACIVQSIYDESDKMAQFKATIFRKINGWQRSDITLLQRCYAESQILDLLSAVGFKTIQVYGYDDEAGLGRVSEQSERMYFNC